MDVRHWTEDEFLDGIYGVGGGDRSHLAGCTECRDRWVQLEARRSRITAEPDVSHDFLAAQRRAIYRRLGEGPSRRFQWAPALAAMLMLVLGLFLFRPGSAPQVQPPKADDAVFSEVYSLEQSSEPMAAKPMEALFEEQ